MVEYIYYVCHKCKRLIRQTKIDWNYAPKCPRCGVITGILNSFGKFLKIKIKRMGVTSSFTCVFENCEVVNCSICTYFNSTVFGVHCHLFDIPFKRCTIKKCTYLCDAQYVYLIDRLNELTGQKIPYLCCRCSSQKENIDVSPHISEEAARWVRTVL